jgi:hypothetical protein
MKIAKYLYLLIVTATFLTIYACRETTVDPNVPFETAVHGYGEFKTPANFSLTDSLAPVNFKWRWVSIDKANTVNKVEFFIYFDEPFKDKDGNPKTARHGGVAGEDYLKLLKVVSAPAPNFGFTDFSVTQADVYNLFKANTFDYGDGKGVVNVFSQNGRKPLKPFIAGDKFAVRWILYTADGRKFDSWTTNVCGDFVGANCILQFVIK